MDLVVDKSGDVGVGVVRMQIDGMFLFLFFPPFFSLEPILG